jgi:siroheme decarboxylase
MNKLTAKEQKVASLIQMDIPLVNRPFLKLAGTENLSEDEVLDAIKTLMQNGFIRKFGAILRHQKVGFTRNALVVWSVPKKRTQEAGIKLASCNYISHCYERKPAFRNKYNLFTMLHAKEKDIAFLIRKTALSLGINDYLILESIEEYKKTSPEYF